MADENLQLWRAKGPSSYTYVVDTLCFCVGNEPIRIVVKDGAVTDVVGMRSGVPRPDRSQTMSELLEAVRRDAGRDHGDFDAHYDADLGYLKALEVDLSGSADDEFSTTVTCFSASTDESACPVPVLEACSGESRARAIDPVDAAFRTCLGGVLPEGRLADGAKVCCPAPDPKLDSATCTENHGVVIMAHSDRTPSCQAPDVEPSASYLGAVTDTGGDAVCCSVPD